MVLTVSAVSLSNFISAPCQAKQPIACLSVATTAPAESWKLPKRFLRDSLILHSIGDLANCFRPEHRSVLHLVSGEAAALCHYPHNARALIGPALGNAP